MRSPAIVALLFVATTAGADVPARRAAIDAFIRDADARAGAAYDAGRHGECAAAYESIPTAVDLALVPDRRPGIYYNLACCYALAGQVREAMDALEQAVSFGWSNAAHLARDTDLDALRDDERFRALEADLARQAEADERRWSSPAFETAFRETLPVAERIAGLSRLWSEVSFAFAYFDQVPDLDWHAEYLAYLPRVMESERTIDYYRLLAELVAKLEDGHTNVSVPRELNDRVLGRPGLSTALVDGRVLVTALLDDDARAAGVSVGDEVLAIDDIPVEAYANDRVAPYVFASTPQDREVRVYDRSLLRGDVDQPVRLRLARGDATEYEAGLPRRRGYRREGPNVEWRRLDDGIGYLEIHTFNESDVDSLVRTAFADLADAEGLVIDIRGNGGGSSGWWVMRHLVDRCETTRWSAPRYVAVHRAWGRSQTRVTGSHGTVTAAPSDTRFDGPVVLLIGPRTYSAAEDFAVAFAHSGRGKMVGRATGGSTGQPLAFSLPGGGRVRVCAKRDTYPDGRAFVGVGVQPDVTVAPTAEDVRTGHDRALETARAIVLAER